MANLYPAQTGPFTTSEQWCDADDDVQDTAFTSSDSAVLTAGSATVTMDQNWESVAISATGASTWDFATYTATVSGDITLDDITATWESGLITAANLDIGANGTLTLAGIGPLVGNMEIDGGTFDMAGNELVILGDFIYTSGDIDNPGDLTMAGDGDVDISSSGNLVETLTIGAEVTADRVAAVNARGLVVAATAELSASNSAFVMNVRPGAAADFVQVLGTMTTAPLVLPLGSTTSNALDVSGVPEMEISSYNKTLTWTGLLDVGALAIKGNGTNRYTLVVMDASGFDLGDVLLGEAGSANRPGQLTFTDVAGSLTSLAQARLADTTNGQVDLATSNLSLSGTIDATEITVTAAGANIVGGTLTNVDSTGLVHSWGSTLSGTNSVDVTKESSLGGATANVGTGIGMAA